MTSLERALARIYFLMAAGEGSFVRVGCSPMGGEVMKNANDRATVLHNCLHEHGSHSAVEALSCRHKEWRSFLWRALTHKTMQMAPSESTRRLNQFLLSPQLHLTRTPQTRLAA